VLAAVDGLVVLEETVSAPSTQEVVVTHTASHAATHRGSWRLAPVTPLKHKVKVKFIHQSAHHVRTMPPVQQLKYFKLYNTYISLSPLKLHCPSAKFDLFFYHT
jgi:hypothetical protein